MDAELVNMFIDKQRETINDAISRIVMLEARLAISERRIEEGKVIVSDMHAKHTLQQNIHTEKEEASVKQLEEHKAAIKKKDVEIADLKIKGEKRNAELEEMRRKFNDLALQRDQDIQKLQKVKKQVKQLAED